MGVIAMARILAIGDIHGCYRSLDTLLSLVQPNSDDTLVTLGDYVDRGPMSCRVIERLIELENATRLVPLRGNHECMMLLARSSLYDARRWMVAGGAETLDSYNGKHGKVANLEDIPVQHWEFISDRLLRYWETDNFIFVHGSVDSDVPMPQQPEATLHWARFSTQKAMHQSGKVVVCGHERQETGLPAKSPFAICIDTGAWDSGWLTCLDPIAGKIWQADERGQTRHLDLHEID